MRMYVCVRKGGSSGLEDVEANQGDAREYIVGWAIL